MKEKVAVLGGGISGLAAAYYLKERFDVTLFEEKEQVGGWIQTDRVEGFLFERGPRTLRVAQNGLLLELVKEIGLEPIYSQKASSKRYIVSGGKLRNVSYFLFKYFFTFAKELFVRRKKETGDETIEQFVSRRFSKGIARDLVDPIVQGIYGGDIAKLSLRSCFPFLEKMEGEKSSIIRAMLGKTGGDGRLFSFKGGLQSFTQRLANELGSSVHLGERVVSIKEQSVITEKQGKQQAYAFDHIVCALPLKAAAALLKKSVPELSNIESNSLTVVNLGFNCEIKHPKGFGFLVPTKEKKQLMGVIFDSDIFAELNSGCSTRMTAMLRGVDYTEQQALSEVLKGLREYIQLDVEPCYTKVHYACDAIAQYVVGHSKKVKKIEQQVKQVKGLHLIGSYLHSPSLSGCVASARACTQNLQNS